jgi:hypothetical protein
MAGPAAISGGIGAMSLFIMRSRLDDQLQKQSQGLATANYETGFTLAVLFMIAGAAWSAYLFLQGRRIEGASPELKGAAQEEDRRAPI